MRPMIDQSAERSSLSIHSLCRECPGRNLELLLCAQGARSLLARSDLNARHAGNLQSPVDIWLSMSPIAIGCVTIVSYLQRSFKTCQYCRIIQPSCGYCGNCYACSSSPHEVFHHPSYQLSQLIRCVHFLLDLEQVCHIHCHTGLAKVSLLGTQKRCRSF